jgi:hypothetical protein
MVFFYVIIILIIEERINMERIKKDFFRLFLIALLVMPMMVKALPVSNTNTSYSTVLLEEKQELTKEDYEEKNQKLCTVCILLDIIILICIAALVVRLLRLKAEKKENGKN